MQNLTTSANFQMFSKVHHDAVPSHTQQSPRTNASVSAGDIGEQQGKGQHGQLSAADLHQMMLNQLDQQLYLSQFAGLGASSDASGAAPPPDSSSSAGAVNPFQHFSSSADLPTSSAAVCHASDSATTTTSSASSTSSATDGKPCAATGASGGMYGADSSLSSAELLGQQLTHQKLMEQFLEVATTVAGGGGGNQQQMSGGSTTPSAEEMMVSQLMAQLVNGTSVPNGGGTETHGQMTAQHQFGTGGAHQQQQQQHQRKTDGGSQSPSSSSHNQQQPLSMSLIDQLQILQMLGSPGANPQSLSGFAELFAAGGLPSSTSSENLAQLLKGVGGAGGSPSKAEQVYCELCDKWLCNRYFMKTHMLKKHGIGEATSTTNSPLKNGVGNFSFASSAQFSADEHSVRPNSASQSVQPPQMELMAHHHNESPPVGRLAPKLSLSSTPGTISGNGPGDNQTTAFTEALSPDHSQQMAVMQQLAAQLGLSNGGNATEGERNALEQLLGSGGLHLAELMAHAQNQQQNTDMNRCPSPSSVRSPPATLSGSDLHHQSQQNVPSSVPSSSFACAQCAKHFPSQSALFQHQLIAHIGGTDAPQQQQQQSTASNDTQSTVNALAMLAAAGINGGSGTTQQQQQQLFGQLLGSNPFSQGTTPSLMFNNSSAFGGINPTEFDGAAMLAKLSAEFAAVAQAQHSQSGAISATTVQSTGGPSTQQNGAMGRGHTPAPSNKPPPQKRQYSSTSKNFCDLCNKEVCNKYFLRTHMLKMHNIIIDENKQLIANIDTVDKERKGEVKFRCDICHTSMNTREELKLHKRESHGMHAGGGGSQSAPLGGARGVPKATSSSASQPTAVSMDTAETNQQQQQKRVAMPLFAPAASDFNAIEHQTQQQQSTQRRTTSEGTEANDENNQPLGVHSPQQQQTREAAGAQQPSLVGANPMKQLLSLIGGDEALPPSLIGGARLLRTTGERNDFKKDTEEEHLGHRIADANNNATNCRFCGLCLEEEGQLQLHQLMEHPNEYMAELQPTMDLPHSASTEDKLINQVALQMAEANSHNHHHHHQQQQQHQHQRQFPQLRKTSVASSGASSSSAASFGEVGTAHPPQQQKTKKGTPSRGENADGDDENGGGGGRHQCPQCKRIYKSAQRLEGHQRMVHHNFVAKMSPAKRSIISPKKIAKLMSSFSCHKCRRRFASRGECDEHVLSHIRSGRLKQEEAEDEQPQEEEEEGGERAPQVKRPKMVEEGEEDEVAEQHHREDGVRKVGEKTNIAGGVEEEERQQSAQRRTKGGTGGGEKHSHTSGSTSPVSVQAGSSGGVLPEGFAHPLLDHTKPFVLQSFTLRPVSPHSNCQLPDELVAYLPVRSTLGQPIRVTFELNPTPHVDQQVQHL